MTGAQPAVYIYAQGGRQAAGSLLRKRAFEMKRFAAILMLLVMGVLGCRTLGGRNAAGDRDCLLGWYRLPACDSATGGVIPDSGPMIPVFKLDGTYYSVMGLGIEVPLRVCPEGLELDISPSSMEGTIIGWNATSRRAYIRIADRVREMSDESYVSGATRELKRTRKPSWLLDGAARRPRENDDFLGWYRPVWYPWCRFEVRKVGETYYCTEHEFDGQSGSWQMHIRPDEQTFAPLPDRPGFVLGQGDGATHNLIYDEARRRFEWTTAGGPSNAVPAVLRMPLARIRPPSAGKKRDSLPDMDIGIPFQLRLY